MKTSSLLASLLLSACAFAATGCAVFTKGKTQSVVVRSVPAGATVKINGTEVGQAPFRVELARAEVYRLDLSKPGFGAQSALLMPSTEQYDQRLLRWGIDYQLGAAADLLPGELVVELKPSLGDLTLADRYEELAAQINRADAMLASGELTAADHKFLIAQITASYQPPAP